MRNKSGSRRRADRYLCSAPASKISRGYENRDCIYGKRVRAERLSGIK